MFLYNSIPSIVVHDNVLNEEECNYVIDFAQARGLEENKINVGEEMVSDPMRTSKGTFAKHDEDRILNILFERIASVVGVPLTRAETANIQCYKAGGEYKPHYDAFAPDEVMPEIFKVEEAGNRAVTAIVYLNDVSGGGGTGFPELGIIVKAFAGRVLIFGNLDENKQLHPLSLHTGLPPEDGDKWIFTLWFRERDFMVTKKDLQKALKQLEGKEKKKPVSNGKQRSMAQKIDDIASGRDKYHHLAS
tara:strand:- start:4930 stop:5670 length:741 start_codon:yes stop_codon:yes gene_type:complete